MIFLLKMLSANYRMRRRGVLQQRSVKPFQRRLYRHLKANTPFMMIGETRPIPAATGKTIQFFTYALGTGQGFLDSPEDQNAVRDLFGVSN